MTKPIRNRSRLMLGCGSAALALALALAPQGAQAQGIDATGNVVFGSAEISDLSPSETLVEAITPTVVVDWTPNEDGSGNALPFIRTGALARFESPSLANFALLNRILPATNGNMVVIDGSVISRVFDVNSGGLVQGGFVAFYSPTGILIGNNASFDVGSLMLTTLDVTNLGFQSFAEFGGSMTLQGAPGSTARIEINPGTKITATPENSFFAVVAADVKLFGGNAYVNGSHAYVAGEVVSLSISNGLFTIAVPLGTAAGGNVLELAGTVGGPSSTGVGDNHMIYAVAAAQADPISMVFRNNLGFDPAQSAGVVNGEIILSANYNVSGRTVDGGSISDGIGAVFNNHSETSTVRADILMEEMSASSSVLAISTHSTQMIANASQSAFDGNLLLVGRERAELSASNGYAINISGDVLVSAADYGLISFNLQSLDQLNATGGVAVIEAIDGGSISIGGNALVSADAFGGLEDFNFIAGAAQGGQARIGATDGTLTINGNTTVTARGLASAFNGIATGATVRGGQAQVFAAQNGQVTLGGSLDLDASATGARGSLFTPSSVSDAYGGTASINILPGGFFAGGTISIAGDAIVNASGIGGSSNNAGAGSLGDGGVAVVNIDEAGQIAIGGRLLLAAEGLGGTNAGGIGGTGLGGRASSRSTVGTISVGTDFVANASGTGGNGQTGGDGLGGIASANAITGAITIDGNAVAIAEGIGGSASFEFGGNGGLGRGGNAFLQANGTLTESARVSIGGNASAFASGYGGTGGSGDGALIDAGRGGDGIGGQFTLPNQADPAFNSGAFILAGSDNGTINVDGETVARASGIGGTGGDGFDLQSGGDGGNGLGGRAQVGLALLGQSGALGQGSAAFRRVLADASGFGGEGGITGSGGVGGNSGIDRSGNGGNGTGGGALLTVRAGDITADQIDLFANGTGGEGQLAGNGTGGEAALLGGQDGSIAATGANISAQGFGGGTFFGTGGNGLGGLAQIEVDAINVQINGNIVLDASGTGGSSDNGAGGNGTGGEAYIAQVGPGASGNLSVSGHSGVLASGFGGNATGSFAAGSGQGGHAWVRSQGGARKTFGSLQVAAVGRGGLAPTHQGGNGTGGLVQLLAFGTGSQLTVLRNVPDVFASNSLAGEAMLNASGIGEAARGGSGIGGTAIGGTLELTATTGGSIALPTDLTNDPNSTATTMLLLARGIAGGSAVDGGTGGEAFGGNATIFVDGGTITVGPAVISALAQGGGSLNDTISIAGGAAVGGNRSIRVINGGSLTMAATSGGAGALGGNGSGSANGGNANAGDALFEVIGSSVNLVGDFNLSNEAQGGSGARGGDAGGGALTFRGSNATINLLPDAAGNAAILIGGAMQGGNGASAGGGATASNATINLTNTQLRGGGLAVNPLAIGGNASAANGQGGSATGGQVAINVTGSQLDLVGETLFTADARGGASNTGANGGAATSGTVDMIVSGSQIAIAPDGQGNPGILLLRSQANGGDGATMGTAASGRASLNLANATLSASQVAVEARGFANATTVGQTGSSAAGGQALVNLLGTSRLTTGLLDIISNAWTSSGGTALAGTSALQLASGSTAAVDATQINLLADALGADFGSSANGAGQFSVNVGGGNVNTSSLIASATGDAIIGDPPASELVASGGSINVSGNISATARGDVLLRTSGGGIIGGPRAASTLTNILVQSHGTITIEGDNNAAVGVGGATISLAANDLDIGNGARIGADVVNIASLNRANTAVLGGTTNGDGFTLTADEFGRISARGLNLDFAELANPAAANQPALLIRDLTITGSASNGLESVRIFTGGDGPFGITRIEGQVSYTGAAGGDQLSIETGRLEVVTPGGVRIEQSAGVPGGVLALNARDIWVADADTITRLQADRNFAGRDELLAGAATGSADPLGYLQARGVEIRVRDSLLVRNTGAAFEGGGILVGDGGLSITGTGISPTGAPLALDVFAYGRRLTADGSFILGEAFFDEVNFNRIAPGTSAYLDAAAFNDCIINTGECPQPTRPVEPPEVINNHTIIEVPIQTGEAPPIAREEEEARFGIDFPEQPDAPLNEEEPLLDDPVTSGGDASLYSDGGTGKPGSEDK